MPVPRYIEPLISSVLLTSVTTHLIYNRRAFADEQSRLVAQTTILQDLVRRLREGERIPDVEYDRLIALAGRGGLAARQTHFYDAKRSETSWRDTILGQKVAPPSPHLQGESDENILREEWEAGMYFFSLEFFRSHSLILCCVS